MSTPLLLPETGRTRTLRRWAGCLLALALPALAAPAAQAQSVANYTFAASSGTYTALAGGTAAGVTSTDEAVSAALPIGFTFVYNGVAYTTFSASTNGFMNLGSALTASALTNNLTSGGTPRPIIAPLWDDNDISATTNLTYQTTGAAGSRVLTVEWLNVKWNYNATAAGISHQVKLYEADGHLDFVYRQEAGALNSASASIGISAVATGSGNFLSLSDATAAPTASSTTETTSISTKPATGQVYTFTAAGGTVAAPSGLTFSALSTSTGTVTFTDNSTNEFNFAVTLTPTAGGPAITTTTVASTTGTGTGTTYSASFTGLAANTSYTVSVVALGQGRGSTAATGTFSTTAGATLSGVYYVGTGTSPQPTRTYPTLTAAANAYTAATLTGPVTFLLLDAAYGPAETFPITLGVNNTASATNTLTISPNPGVNATIMAPATVTAPSTGGGVLVLNGADYIILDGANATGATTRNLTLTAANTTGVAVVQLVSLGVGAGATNNTIRNLILTSSSSNAGVGIVVGGATLGTTGADNDNLTIQNNSITSSFSGIFVLGTAAVSAGGTDGLVITGNTLGGTTSGTSSLGNIGLLINNAVSPSLTLNTIQNILGTGTPAGINMTGVTGATISQNTVQNVGSSGGNAFGLQLGAGSTGATVSRNRLLNIYSTSTAGYGGKGIDVQTGSATSNVTIANNFVQVTALSGYTSLTGDSNVGIRLGTGGMLGGVNLYFNSVNLTGTDPFNSADLSAALYIGSATTALDVRNNIFRNSIVNSANTGAKAYAIYSASANTAFTQLNYNDYFVSGTQGVLGYLGADQATLAALQTATGKDQNSLNVDPQFVSATDLHVGAVSLNNVGTPITGITTDIDGDVRNTTTPDIGADEFTPSSADIAANGLVAPAVSGTSGACFGSAEAVTVSVRNAGTATLNFATTPATITVVITGPTGVATQTLTYTLNTGTLASGATLSVPLTGAGTTANLSTVGTYSFAITATVPGDGNAGNNTLTPSPTVVVGAPVAGTLSASTTSICVSGTATLTLAGFQNGNVQLQSSTSATGTFTNVAGATSGTYTTPTLTSSIFYRAQVTCGTTVVTSNVVGITVNNPVVISAPAPAAVCAGQTATLTATSAAGTAIRFFSTATGGTALTGATTSGTNPVTTSQVTPVLTTAGTTTFYAEAVSGTQENVGLPAALGTSSFISVNYGLIFNTTGPATLTSTVIYPTGTGTVTFALQDNAGTDIAVTPAINVTGTGASTPVTVPLNLTVPAAGTGYRLALKAYTGITNLVRDNPLPTTSPFPFTSPSGLVSITGGLLGGGPSTSAYYFFYNIQVGNQCVAATRTAIAVTVNPAANAGFSYSATNAFCTSQTTAQAVTLATGATAGTFTVSPATGLTINATTGAITPSTSTPGTYTVTNTVAANGSVCSGTATTTVTITAPQVATFSYPAASGTVSYCVGATGTIAPTLSTGAVAGTFTVSPATGLTINATTGALNLANATAGTYTVTNTVAASGACAAQTATQTVTVAALPTATLSAPTAGPVAICQGSSVVLTAPAGTGLTYQFFSGTTSLGAASATNTVTANSAGSYSVVVTNASGCTATSAAVAVTVNLMPATPTVTVTGNAATGLTLTASSTTTGVTYQFYRNGVLIANTTGNTLLVNSGTNNGTYTVVAVSAQGCSSAASASQTVTVTATAGAGAAASVRLYPNPTPDGRVSVELKGYPAAASLTLLNALGQVVRTLPAASPNGTTLLDLHELADGVYLLQVQAAGTGPQTLRVVKN